MNPINSMNSRTFLTASLAAVMALAACGGGGSSDDPQMNTSIVRELSANPVCARVIEMSRTVGDRFAQSDRCVD